MGEGQMDELEKDVGAARALGISYGKYKALLQEQGYLKPRKESQTITPKRSRRRFTTEAAFALWQQGKSDREIGRMLGVSRQIIQRWRDTLELPSVCKHTIDTGQYRLIYFNGECYIMQPEGTRLSRIIKEEGGE